MDWSDALAAGAGNVYMRSILGGASQRTALARVRQEFPALSDDDMGRIRDVMIQGRGAAAGVDQNEEFFPIDVSRLPTQGGQGGGIVGGCTEISAVVTVRLSNQKEGGLRDTTFSVSVPVGTTPYQLQQLALAAAAATQNGSGDTLPSWQRDDIVAESVTFQVLMTC